MRSPLPWGDHARWHTSARRRDGEVAVSDPHQPEFGPSGYLPERASKRARKIVLRAPLGLQWVIASVVAGLVVLVAGVLFLQRGQQPPPAPWVDAGPVERIDPARADDELGVLLIAAGGQVRAFVGADAVGYCPASNRLEATDGRVWSLTGRGFADTPSLAGHPTQLRSGRVYVDPTTTLAGPEPTADAIEPAC
jgi:hypothetical protein